MAEKPKPLSKEEMFTCEMTWGGIPLVSKSKNLRDYDIVFIRGSKLFQEKWEMFESGEWDELYKWDLIFKKKYNLC